MKIKKVARMRAAGVAGAPQLPRLGFKCVYVGEKGNLSEAISVAAGTRLWVATMFQPTMLEPADQVDDD